MATSRSATYSCRSSSTAGDVTVHAPTGNEQPKELSLPAKSQVDANRTSTRTHPTIFPSLVRSELVYSIRIWRSLWKEGKRTIKSTCCDATDVPLFDVPEPTLGPFCDGERIMAFGSGSGTGILLSSGGAARGGRTAGVG